MRALFASLILLLFAGVALSEGKFTGAYPAESGGGITNGTIDEGLIINRTASGSAAGLDLRGNGNTAQCLMSWSITDGTPGSPGDALNGCIVGGGSIRTVMALGLSGDWTGSYDANGDPIETNAGIAKLPQAHLTIVQDVETGISILPSPLDRGVSIWSERHDESVGWIIDNDGREFYCNDTDLTSAVTVDWDNSAETVTASAGTPYSTVNAGDFVAITDATGNLGRTNNDGLYEVASVGGGGSSLTLTGSNSIIVNTGTYEVSGSTVTTKPMIAKSAEFVGGSSVAEFELDGDMLTLKSQGTTSAGGTTLPGGGSLTLRRLE